MKVVVVIPNWNGVDGLKTCIPSIQAQTHQADIVVVDNGSIDTSVEYLEEHFTNIIILKNSRNLGFAGGVNTGIRWALQKDYDSIALFNNDAVAEPAWLERLCDKMSANPTAAIVTGLLLSADGATYDSTGEQLSIWGLPYPRGRGQAVDAPAILNQLDKPIFSGSGGASLYRVEVLRKIGLFDEDFFAYYEDIDIGFRARLAGYDVLLESKAIAYHQIGATSGRMKHFTTKQSFRNTPMLIIKNVPLGLLWQVAPRFALAYTIALTRRLPTPERWAALSGWLWACAYTPKKLYQRLVIQRSKTVTTASIATLLDQSPPPGRPLLHKLDRLMGRRGTTKIIKEES